MLAARAFFALATAITRNITPFPRNTAFACSPFRTGISAATKERTLTAANNQTATLPRVILCPSISRPPNHCLHAFRITARVFSSNAALRGGTPGAGRVLERPYGCSAKARERTIGKYRRTLGSRGVTGSGARMLERTHGPGVCRRSTSHSMHTCADFTTKRLDNQRATRVDPRTLTLACSTTGLGETDE